MVFDLRTRPGDANIKSLSLTLSKSFAIDQRHLGNLCSEAELAQTQCAGRQAIGTASTRTPLLDAPLSGPVYAVSGSGGLPRLAFVLDGQVSLVAARPVGIDQVGRPEDRRADHPRRPDRPLPLQPLRRQEGLPGQHPQPLPRGAGLDRRLPVAERQARPPAGAGQGRLRGERQAGPELGARSGEEPQLAASGSGSDDDLFVAVTERGFHRGARLPTMRSFDHGESPAYRLGVEGKWLPSRVFEHGVLEQVVSGSARRGFQR